jgi:multidrug efflux pump subunit AcrB
MILIFLGSWLGATINIMTLGGLALAVGILVDDATVEIENTNRNIDMGKEIEHAILDGAQEIAAPAFVATLSIWIVFVPMFLLTGVARYLFVPLSEAVVFAMLASYFLSRTLVPTMSKYLLTGHEHDVASHSLTSRNPLVRWQVFAFTHFPELWRSLHSGIQSAFPNICGNQNHSRKITCESC